MDLDQPDPLAAAFPGTVGLLTRCFLGVSSFFERRGLIHGALPPLRAALAQEIHATRNALCRGDLDAATSAAGRLHVLGSYYAVTHFYSHQTHLRVEWRRRNLRGVFIQALRLAGTPFTRPIVPFIGVTGHPGTSDRAIGTCWAIESDLQSLLDAQPRPDPLFGTCLFARRRRGSTRDRRATGRRRGGVAAV